MEKTHTEKMRQKKRDFENLVVLYTGRMYASLEAAAERGVPGGFSDGVLCSRSPGFGLLYYWTANGQGEWLLTSTGGFWMNCAAKTILFRR
jgi:hypothetical protein